MQHQIRRIPVSLRRQVFITDYIAYIQLNSKFYVVIFMKNKSKYKISFCTVCMNRAHHLKLTLPKNIKDNQDYENVEFVVLNYNSKDDLDEWIKAEMMEYINKGILIYVKTKEPKHFFMSHSKNVVARSASGDIICNVDADNYMGEGFASYINNQYRVNQNIYLAVNKETAPRDCYGRICVWRDDFFKIKGYDEGMLGYGFEDFDLRNRLELLGRGEVHITDLDFLKAITHKDAERLKSEKNAKSMDRFFINHIDSARSSLLYLFEDGVSYEGIIAMNRLLNSTAIENLFLENRTFEYPNSLWKDCWNKSSWRREKQTVFIRDKENDLVLEPLENEQHLFQLTAGNDVQVYRQVVDRGESNNMIMFFSQINNRIKMRRNRESKKITVNISFGKARLLKNFSKNVKLN